MPVTASPHPAGTTSVASGASATPRYPGTAQHLSTWRHPRTAQHLDMHPGTGCCTSTCGAVQA